jgi:hypothetical protein
MSEPYSGDKQNSKTATARSLIMGVLLIADHRRKQLGIDPKNCAAGIGYLTA